ncbi:beta-xylosidase/alpha-l-arabinosidase [Pengzhenrongella sicca]|uniref:Glycoside hydrolase family 3 C-terminal domain-containing protein n=1 Tax=Pengzhenrongella sicca TaxID=2819238 RepID=A0A8A4ZD92_9MICO|nr:glycoside hydrolase family 3 N-terminal domain-containing protein [Pengzhenrongella sicca]QTE29391.1 glycoside hydrolase family 3 C-terminal domain-containing protein [Pengzhenrongella sicca]
MNALTQAAVSRGEIWRDPLASPAQRADDLVPRLTLEEKLAQLVGVWVGANPVGGGVAPMQSTMSRGPLDWDALIQQGLGQLTRPFGTAPIEPIAGAAALADLQSTIVAANRFGIPALVHEECLAGFAAWGATAYPVPLSWGATFDPDLVAEMSGLIGASMRSVGVHQGLAPVLDVTRDYRWGRTEETISEDPYLVSTVGAAYVRGLEDAGIIATLKHFAGYSASRSGRNLAPVAIGPREFADVILPPFEAALRLGGARSVMNSYAEIDGVPVAGDPRLLTELLRDTWGFEGTVVADYFAVRFLETLHGVAGDAAVAAGLALRAGIDVELPTVDAYGEPLLQAVRAGAVDEALVDRALRRVLAQKAELGLLDESWRPGPATVARIDLDSPASRDVALRLAREAVVLLTNPHGILPLAPAARVAVVGPLADEPMAMLGCYSFPAHVGVQHPELPIGLDIASVVGALRVLHPEVTCARGCDVSDPDRSGLGAAVAAAQDADVCIVAVGDRAGLFGRGTSGEGCDAADLSLPGVQANLVRAVLATGTPVVLLLLTGRPYALGEFTGQAAAIVQAFFPGQLGGRAIAEILTGAISPSGRLPVSVPRDPGSQPSTYLAPALGHKSGVSNIDPTPAFPFGHGLGYDPVRWGPARVVPRAGCATADAETPEWAVDASVEVELTVSNASPRRATDIVQLYLHDPVAQVTRPVVRLIGYARVALEAGQSACVTFTVHSDHTSFTGLDGQRIVEPGDVELRVARSSADVHAVLPLRLVGAQRQVGYDRQLVSAAKVTAVSPVHEEEEVSVP